MLTPPPLPDHVVSEERTSLPVTCSVVPPTPVTLGSEAKYSTWSGRLSSGSCASGGIVISPTTVTGQRAMKAVSRSGATPPFPSSPATLTSIITWVSGVP